jgi:nicotinate-nucleotide--dimethylbenzimidazole phosphoribosyltransferase
MNTDRIQRLQSLLDRIKKKATLPKQSLGQGFVLGGTLPTRSDVSAGPSVPAQAAPIPMATRKNTQPMQVTPLQASSPPKPATSVQPQAPVKPAAPAQPEVTVAQATPPMQPAQPPAQTAPQPMRSIKMTQPMQLMTPLQPEPTPKPAPVAEPTPAKPAQAAEPTPVKPETPAQPTPSAQPQARPSFWQSAQAAARPDAPVQSGQPAAPASSGTSSSTMQAVHSPLVAVPSVSAGMVDGRKARARVPTVIGVAPDFGISKQEPPKEEEAIEELDADEVLDAQSSLPPPPTAEKRASEDEKKKEPEAAVVEARRSNSDIDNLSWSEPPSIEVEIEEPPPDSSPRARVPGSIDEALASVSVDSEPEAPVKTPPPESGRQPAEGVYTAPIPPTAVPTPEQLGDTLELEAPTVAELELDLGPAKLEPVKEELEVEIPKQASVLEPISSIEPQRAPEPSHVEIIPEEASAARQQPDAEPLELQPNVTRRPAAGDSAKVQLVQSVRAFAPRSFLELLDASLKLGSK